MASVGGILLRKSPAARGPWLPFVFPRALLTASLFLQCEVHQCMRRGMTERGRGGDKELTCRRRSGLPTKYAADLLLSRSKCLPGQSVKRVRRRVMSIHHVLYDEPARRLFNPGWIVGPFAAHHRLRRTWQGNTGQCNGEGVTG